MDTKHIKITFPRIVTMMVILATTLSVSTVAYAATPSPFIGNWQAIDVDGSDLRLTIAGPPTGPYKITWTESYISFCNMEAGILYGVGWLNEEDDNLLEADLHVECFTTGDSLDFHLKFQYHPATNTLSSIYENGFVTIWHRPGGGHPEEPPALGLRVNYGHDWVESFYEGGHTTWVTVTDGDGNLKATAEIVTEPKDFWGGETGFQTQSEDWNPGPPDIQPYDWVYGWVDNGASAQVQIGEINGAVHLVDDFIEGTIYAPWFSDELEVDCHSWGAPLPEEILKYDAVLPDGEDTYSCSWAGEWNIQPGQDVGVGYSGPDGHWVANAFYIPMPTLVAYVPGAVEGYDWPIGDEISLTINDALYPVTAISEQRPDFPEGETRILFEIWEQDWSITEGDHVVMTDLDNDITKDVNVTNLAVTEINVSEGTVSGIYDPAFDLWVWLYGQDGFVPDTYTDGTWVANFGELLPDTWGGATQWEPDGDGTSIDFYIQ